MGKKRIKLIDDSVLEKQLRSKKKGDAQNAKVAQNAENASNLSSFRSSRTLRTSRDKLKIKSGKADEARLADMGQKALAELEERQAKEKESSVPPESSTDSVLPAGKAGLQKKHSEEKAKKAKPPKARSKRYQSIKKNIKSNNRYSITEALELIVKETKTSFDESLEIHLVLKEKVSGLVTLPHGNGKKQKVAIATEKILTQIKKGKIDFDILVSPPAMMPKLAKAAKILGPKGLMPNPKTGTISKEPEKLKEKLESGQVHFKTEPKAPLLHFTFGKVSFGQKKLQENLKAFLSAVGENKILKASLCSTMSPGVKIDTTNI